ncbi:tetratricopeptide repeat protein [Neobacillus massiliamazoniensis]|jgi:tetratricopeptide (TPR) repeat protein|uniref:TPR-like protein n=1 Tax=Neobacillus massiliamazoniensis TaxID=1499688 RepID=A0A0U1P254_9BACI|nr:tetratricopeptide repeat protein [Neobacillus massiliamazoniensis]CRK84330.1 TPR-like protein [Neobacillus massiliamazoniensis]
MKKRERAKKIGNVIFIPGLEQRLKDKGLESLQMKKYNEAIILLEEAKELNPEDGEILIGLVLAYFEASSFKKAKTLTNEMLLKGIGDYFQIVDLHLSILIQLHEYEEIVTTLEVLLEEKEFPPDKHSHFLTLLQFSKRMAENNKPDEDLPHSTLNLLSLHNLNEQMAVISNLADRNIRPYIPEIQDYLCSDEGHPFLKTILLTLLKDQEFDKEVKVRKFNLELKVVPAQLPEIQLQPKMKEIEKRLADILENNNPVLFDNIIGLVERIFFISFPFELQPESVNAWAAAFHLLGQDYFGIEPEIDEISNDYQVSREKIELAMTKIREVEEISIPNI